MSTLRRVGEVWYDICLDCFRDTYVLIFLFATFYDFGANLSELTHEIGSEDGDKEAIKRIAKAARKYAPFISLQTFEMFTDHHDNEHTGKLGIRVVYDIPKLSITDKAIEVILYSTG